MIYFSIAALCIVGGVLIATAYWMAKWRDALGVKQTDYGDFATDYVRRIVELQKELEQAKKNDMPRDEQGRWTRKS